MKWIAIGVVLLVPVFFGVVWYMGQSSLSSQLAALRAEEMPTNLKELNDFYAVPEGVEDTTELWLKAFDAVEAADLFNRGKGLPIISDGPSPIPPPGEEWAEFEAARTLISELGSELQALHTASGAGGQICFPHEMSVMNPYAIPEFQSARSTVRLLTLTAYAHAHEKNCRQSLLDIYAILRLSNAFQGEVVLLPHLYRLSFHTSACSIIEELLPACNWSDENLASLQRELLSVNFRDELITVLQGERAFSLTSIDLFPFSPFRASSKREILKLYEITFKGMKKSWHEALQSQQEISGLYSVPKRNTISHMKLIAVSAAQSALEQTIQSGARTEARQRCTNAAIAARRYQLKHGALPSSLADIEQELLGPESESSASLIDPFDGQPLRYIVEEDRVLVYSIGDNEQDDGGDCERDTARRPLDVGFYLKK